MLFSKNIWRGEADLVAGEGVEGLGGGLLQTREVLRLELGLGLLGERGPHPHPGGGGVGLHQSELGIVTRVDQSQLTSGGLSGRGGRKMALSAGSGRSRSLILLR